MAANPCPRRVRSFSSSNLHATKRIHEYIANQEKAFDQGVNLRREVTKSSMIIPTMGKMQAINPRLPSYTLQLVADTPALRDLEDKGIINWCPQARSLLPMSVDSDGNCLLHSVSVYIWGVHDRYLNLRRFLHKRMDTENRFEGKMYLRWKHEQESPLRGLQIDFESGEIRQDWDSVVFAASEVEFPRGNQGLKYSPLEDIHIFALSNILARPIIVLSETTYHGLQGKSLQPNNISGIYLPLLRNATECEKSPVIIGYNHDHFVPLLSGEDQEMVLSKRPIHPDAQHCVPLVHKNFSVLPVKFTMPSESNNDLLNTYLDCFNIQISQNLQPAALIKFRSPPAWSIELMWSLFSKAQETFSSFVPANSSFDQMERKPNATPNSAAFILNPQDTSPQSTEPFINKKELTRTGSAKMQSSFVRVDKVPRNPCIRHKVGCLNTGEERLNNLCEGCYDVFVLGNESSAHISKMQEKSEVHLIPAKTKVDAENHKKLYRQVSPPGNHFKKCIISCCTNKGSSHNYDLCRECFDTRFNVQVQEGGHNDTKEQKEGKSPSHSYPEHKDYIKMLCESPGCQEEIVQGTGKCRIHLNEQVPPDCITDTCNNKAIDNKLLLCGECLKKQEEIAVSQDRRLSNEFQAPTIYPSFSKISSGFVPAVSSRRSYEAAETPNWQSTVRSRLPEKTGICRETHCEHFAAPGKQDLCNECFDLKIQITHAEHKSQECRTLGCKRQGQPELMYYCGPCFFAPTKERDSNEMARNDQFSLEAGGNTVSQRNLCFGDTMVHMPQVTEKQEPQNHNGPFKSTTDQQMSQRKYYMERPEYVSMPNSSGQAIQPPFSDTGFVNHGYEAGLYSMAEVGPPQRECIAGGCINPGKVAYNNLCDECYQQAVREERQILEANEERRKVAEKTRNEKLPSDSPYLNPKPCKTRGCPYLINAAGQGYCGRCLGQVGRELPGREPLSGGRNREVPPEYADRPPPVHARDPVRQERVSEDVRQPQRQNRMCVKPFCEFYASGEFGPYCSKCFMEQTKNETTGLLDSDSSSYGQYRDMDREYLGLGRSQIEGNDRPSLCKRSGCDLYGRPERNGFCSQCYNRNVIN